VQPTRNIPPLFCLLVLAVGAEKLLQDFATAVVRNRKKPRRTVRSLHFRHML